MKHMRTLIAVLAGLLVFATAGWAVKAPKSAVASSLHDLRAYQGNTSRGYALCNYCHIAHKFGTSPAGPGPLLWNKTLSSASSYGIYTSPSFNQAVAGGATEVAGTTAASNLCLSCHDGTVALNSFYESVSGASYAGTMVAAKVVSDLTKQHPVNFTYDATVATKAQMLTPNSVASVDAAGDIPLYNGTMQCATCHDPHAGPTVSHLFFRPFPSQTSGSSCTYCHL